MADDSEWSEYISCPVCWEQYTETGSREPKSLTCGHSLCKGCMVEIVSAVEAGSGRSTLTINCPVCRSGVVIRDVHHLDSSMPTNCSLKSIAGYCKANSDKWKKPLRPDDATIIICCETPACNRTVTGNGGRSQQATTSSGSWSQDDFWICSDCGAQCFCSTCACANHEAHAKQRYPVYVSSKCEKIAERLQVLQKDDGQGSTESVNKEAVRVKRVLYAAFSVLDDVLKAMAAANSKLDGCTITNLPIGSCQLALRIEATEFLKNFDERYELKNSAATFAVPIKALAEDLERRLADLESRREENQKVRRKLNDVKAEIQASMDRLQNLPEETVQIARKFALESHLMEARTTHRNSMANCDGCGCSKDPQPDKDGEDPCKHIQANSSRRLARKGGHLDAGINCGSVSTHKKPKI